MKERERKGRIWEGGKDYGGGCVMTFGGIDAPGLGFETIVGCPKNYRRGRGNLFDRTAAYCGFSIR
jgi:hypothetical protein